MAKELTPGTKVVGLSEGDKVAQHSDLAAYEAGNEDVEKELQEQSPENNDPTEVSRVWPLDVGSLRPESGGVKVDVQNFYLEWVLAKYMDVYISEDGSLSREQVREEFGDLEVGEEDFG